MRFSVRCKREHPLGVLDGSCGSSSRLEVCEVGGAWDQCVLWYGGSGRILWAFSTEAAEARLCNTTCKLNNLDLSCQMQESLYDLYRRGDHWSSADFATGKIRRRQAKILYIFPGIIRKAKLFGGRAMLAPTVLTEIVHILSSPICFTNT